MIRPIRDWTVIKPVVPKYSGMIKLLHEDNNPTEGTITAIGSKVVDVKVGDNVRFKKMSGRPFTINGKPIILMQEKEILAVED